MEQKKKIKKPKEDEWMPTQEELLEEAKQTELENIRSLEKYQKLESEKKTKRIVKKTYTGPIIQYKSTRMPVIEENKDDQSDIKCESANKYCERTFITVLNDPNDAIYKKVFNIGPPPAHPKRLKCVISGYDFLNMILYQLIGKYGF